MWVVIIVVIIAIIILELVKSGLKRVNLKRKTMV